MSKSVKLLVGFLIAFTLISVAAMAFIAAKHSDKDQGEDEQEAVKTPSHLSVQNGRTVITLDGRTQAREGIRVEPLDETSRHTELSATAVLLAVNDLATLRNSYVAAVTKLHRDQVDLATSRSQYERTKTLYDENQNMSLQALQNADGMYRNNQAQVTADEQDPNLQLDTVRQHWGTGVADWIQINSPTLNVLLEQREFLAQVVFPPGEVASAPRTLSFRAPGDRLIHARLISPSPQVNPQIQGISYLYLVPNRSGMAVGMNLAALVPVGHMQTGTVVPENAVVWWQGAAWAYEQISVTDFVRHAVPTNYPVSDGYFVPGASFPTGTKLVTTGASELLSKELLAHPQGEGGGAEDSDSD